MRLAERSSVNILAIKYLLSMVGVTRMDRVRTEVVRRRAGMERGLENGAVKQSRPEIVVQVRPREKNG